MKDKQKFMQQAKKVIGESGWAKLGKLLFQEGEETETEVEVEMAEAILADGSKIMYDRMEEGGKVVVITEEGEIPAPDGEHVMPDGTKINTMGGLIVSVAAPEAVAETMETEETTETTEAETTVDMKAIEKMMDDKIAALYQENEAITKEKEEIKEEMASVKAAFSSVIELIEALMETPAKQEREATAQTFNAREQRKANFAKAQEMVQATKEKLKQEGKYK